MGFEELQAALQRAGAQTSAAECHGSLSGWLASGQGADPAAWLDPVVADQVVAEGGVAGFRQALSALYEQVRQQLAGGDFAFAPLLPADEEPLAIRIEALGDWCEGFLYGLGLAGRTAGAGGADVDEVIADFAQIARAGLEPDGGDEADEEAYTQLVEYLRVGAQLVHDTLADAGPQRRLH